MSIAGLTIAIITLNAFVIAGTTAVISVWSPLKSSWVKAVAIVVMIGDIASTTVWNNTGNCPKTVWKAFTIGEMVLITVVRSPPIPPEMPIPKLFKKSVPACVNRGPADWKNVAMALGKDFKILDTIGKKFPKKKVDVVSANA